MQLDRWQLTSHSPVLHLEVTLASSLTEYSHIIFPNNFRGITSDASSDLLEYLPSYGINFFPSFEGTILFIQIMTFNNYSTHPDAHTNHPAQPRFLKSENS